MERKDSYDQLSAMLRMDSLPRLDDGLFGRGVSETAAPAAPEAPEQSSSGGLGRSISVGTEQTVTQALRQLSSAHLPSLESGGEPGAAEAADGTDQQAAAAGGGAQKRQWSAMEDPAGMEQAQTQPPPAGSGQPPATSAGAPAAAGGDDQVGDSPHQPVQPQQQMGAVGAGIGGGMTLPGGAAPGDAGQLAPQGMQWKLGPNGTISPAGFNPNVPVQQQVNGAQAQQHMASMMANMLALQQQQVLMQQAQGRGAHPQAQTAMAPSTMMAGAMMPGMVGGMIPAGAGQLAWDPCVPTPSLLPPSPPLSGQEPTGGVC